jgi:hypothetical protein
MVIFTLKLQNLEIVGHFIHREISETQARGRLAVIRARKG